MASSVLAKMAVYLDANTAAFNSKIAQSNTALNRLANTAQITGKALLASFGVYAIFGILKDGIQILAGFEAEMSKVKALTGATESEFNALRDSALSLGQSSKYTAEQVGTLQTELARIGFTVPEILAATKAVVLLSQATGEDLAKSAAIVGTAIRQFNLPATEASYLADVMTGAFNKTALALDDFGEAMKYVGPQAAVANISFEQTSALLGILANAGIKGSQAGTSLRRILLDLAKDGRPLEDRLKELADKGITVQGALDEVGRIAATSLIVLEKGAGQVKPLTEEFKNMVGESQRVSDIMRDNLQGDFERLTAKIKNAVAEGTIFNEVLRAILKGPNAFGGAGLPEDLTNYNRDRQARRIFLTFAKGYKDASTAAKAYIEIQLHGLLAIQNNIAETNNLFGKESEIAKETSKNAEGEIAARTRLMTIAQEYVRALATEPASPITPKIRFDVNYYEEKIKGLKELQKTSQSRTIWEDYDSQIFKLQQSLDSIAPSVKTLKREMEIANIDRVPTVPESLKIKPGGLDVHFPSVEKLEAQAKALNDISIAGKKVATEFRTTQLVVENFETRIDQFGKKTTRLKEILVNWGQALKDLAAHAIASFADALGRALAGQEDFGKTFLQSFAGFLKQFGELLIAAGVAKIAADLLLTTPAGGYAAVAAGVALVALASFMQAKASSTGGAAGATGTSGRITTGGANYIPVQVTGEFLVRGQDLYLSLNNYNNNKNG